MEKELTAEQAAYINYLKFPPAFYCSHYSKAELPPKYCTKQCFECMADVGEQRIKTKPKDVNTTE